jgi:hypothetical protein
VRRIAFAAVLATLCGCDLGASRTRHVDVGPAVLFVRAPAEVELAGVPALLPQPPSFPADGSEERPFATLRAALLAAPDGALVRIGAGVFRERLLITRPVVLLGRGAGKTRIVAPAPVGPVIAVLGADRMQVYGVSVEAGLSCVEIRSGVGHRLQNVELIGCVEAGLETRGAEVEVVASEIRDVSGGTSGRGVDVDGGALDVRTLSLVRAGRRAVVVHAARARLRDLDVRGSSLSAVQATDGADVRVVRGVFEGVGGAALYAGGARLSVEGARVRHGEYAVVGFRGADVHVEGGELTDYSVAGVAMVNSGGSVRKATIARGGSEAAISITGAHPDRPVLLVDNRISSPGTMGVHVTRSSVTARGNSITGARLDPGHDLGDGFYAIDCELLMERNVFRGNAGSGIVALRSHVRLSDNLLFDNGRAGIRLLDRSHGSASGNLFERNAGAAVELAERARATLVQNRFALTGALDIDTGCGQGLSGTADLGPGNTFAAGPRERNCSR